MKRKTKIKQDWGKIMGTEMGFFLFFLLNNNYLSILMFSFQLKCSNVVIYHNSKMGFKFT